MGKQKRGQEISKGVVVPGLKGKHSHSGTNNGCRVWVSGCLGQLGLTAGWNIMEKVVHGHLGIYLEAVERGLVWF